MSEDSKLDFVGPFCPVIFQNIFFPGKKRACLPEAICSFCLLCHANKQFSETNLQFSFPFLKKLFILYCGIADEQRCESLG